MSSLIRSPASASTSAGVASRRRPVADHRAGVADEVGQGQDAAPVQRSGARPGVGDVGGGRDDPDCGRQRPGQRSRDHARPGAGHQHVGVRAGEQLAGRSGGQAVVQDARVAVLAAQREQPPDLEACRVDEAPGEGGDRDHPAAAAGDLRGHPAAHLAEPLDRHRTARPAAAPAGRAARSRRRTATPYPVSTSSNATPSITALIADGAARRSRSGPNSSSAVPMSGPVRAACVGQRRDLRAVPGHPAGPARPVRRIAHAPPPWRRRPGRRAPRTCRSWPGRAARPRRR